MGNKIDKAMSGRWLLTVTAGSALLVFVIADCVLAFHNMPPVIDPMALLGIISIVISFYFAKPPEGENKTSGQEVKQ